MNIGDKLNFEISMLWNSEYRRNRKEIGDAKMIRG